MSLWVFPAIALAYTKTGKHRLQSLSNSTCKVKQEAGGKESFVGLGLWGLCRSATPWTSMPKLEARRSPAVKMLEAFCPTTATNLQNFFVRFLRSLNLLLLTSMRPPVFLPAMQSIPRLRVETVFAPNKTAQLGTKMF